MATEVEKKAELFAKLESYVRDNGGYLISSPGVQPYRIECSPDSTLPAKIRETGWRIRFCGSSLRIIVAEPVETYVYEVRP